MCNSWSRERRRTLLMNRHIRSDSHTFAKRKKRRRRGMKKKNQMKQLKAYNSHSHSGWLLQIGPKTIACYHDNWLVEWENMPNKRNQTKRNEKNIQRIYKKKKMTKKKNWTELNQFQCIDGQKPLRKVNWSQIKFYSIKKYLLNLSERGQRCTCNAYFEKWDAQRRRGSDPH